MGLVVARVLLPLRGLLRAEPVRVWVWGGFEVWVAN